MSRAPLVISANTLRRADFCSRARAASEAGFDGIGLRVSDYLSAIEREGLRARDLRPILDDYGVSVFEVEAAWDWTDTRSADHRKYLSLLERMFEDLQFAQFNAFLFKDVPHQQIQAGYDALCERLPVTIALENIPYGPVKTLDDAISIVAASNKPNRGLVLDSWHFLRSGSSWEALARVEPEIVRSIQVSNVLGRAMDDLAEEARHYRTLPESGAADLTTWLSTVLATGARCPIAIEVVADAHDGREPTELAEAMLRSLAQLMASAMSLTA